MGCLMSAGSDAWLVSTKGIEWVLELETRLVPFAFSLGFCTILARRPFLTALDSSLTTC